jgi:hypothetical protein
MTVLQIKCPSCAVPLKVPAPVAAGRLVRCPRCKGTFAMSQRLVAPKGNGAPAQPPPQNPPRPIAKTTPPVHSITCPKCRATLRTAGPPPAGKLSKCPRCTTVFRVPGATPAIPARPPAAKPTKLATSGASSPASQITCPKCATTLKTTGPVPPGKAVKCPRCTTVFRTPAKKTTLAPTQPKVTRLTPAAAPPVAKKTTLAPPKEAGNKKAAPKPAFRLVCPACQTVLKGAGTPPKGAVLKCPKCAKPLRLSRRRPPGKPAARTQLAAARAKPTQLAPQKPASPAKKPAARPAAPQPTAKAPPAAPRPTRPPPPPAPAPLPRKTWRRTIQRALYVLVGLATIGLCVVIAGIFGHGPLAQKADLPASVWEEFAPPGSRCRILMPGIPEARDGDPDGTGRRARIYLVTRAKQNVAFWLTYWDQPTSGDTLTKAFAAVRNHLLKKLKGETTSEADVKLDGHPGKELYVEREDGEASIARIYVVKGATTDRVYFLLAGGERIRQGRGNAARFFDSFHID